MADFDVADVVPTSALTEEQITKTLDFTSVHRWKGMDVSSRLCARGFTQWIQDLDDTCASTPVLMVLKILLVFALSMQRSIFTFDITTAFLHAIRNPDDDPIIVWPPEAYFPNKTPVWKHARAVYGLRTVPRVAEILRGRTSEAWIQTTHVRWERLCSHGVNCHHVGICG